MLFKKSKIKEELRKQNIINVANDFAKTVKYQNRLKKQNIQIKGIFAGAEV